jgi:uncharacterized membrane protein
MKKARKKAPVYKTEAFVILIANKNKFKNFRKLSSTTTFATFTVVAATAATFVACA